MEFLLSIKKKEPDADNPRESGHYIQREYFPFERAKGLAGKLGLIHSSTSFYSDAARARPYYQFSKELADELKEQIAEGNYFRLQSSKLSKVSYVYIEGFNKEDMELLQSSIQKADGGIKFMDNLGMQCYKVQGLLKEVAEIVHRAPRLLAA